jgi:hypothetical protein
MCPGLLTTAYYYSLTAFNTINGCFASSVIGLSQLLFTHHSMVLILLIKNQGILTVQPTTRAFMDYCDPRPVLLMEYIHGEIVTKTL